MAFAIDVTDRLGLSSEMYHKWRDNKPKVGIKRVKISFLVSLLFGALVNTYVNPYLPFKF